MTTDKPKTVWVTKYALSAGIKECLVLDWPGDLMRVRFSNGCEMYVRPRDYCNTRLEAVEKITGIKFRNIALLRKQISRIEQKLVNVYSYKPES